MTLTSGLIYSHKLDNLTSDVGGNLTNSGCTTSSGKIGGAYSSGSSNSTKRMYNTTNLGINGGSCSISVWIKINSTHTVSDHPMAVSEYSGAGGSAYVSNGIGFDQGNTQVQFNRLKTAVAWQSAVYSFSPGSGWNHYVYTFNGSTIKGYINGSLVTTASASGNGSPEARSDGIAILGTSYTPSPNRFSGDVDLLNVYNREITLTEVQQLYNAGNGINYPFILPSADNPSLLLLI